jgi:DNA-binding Lrp family transcriptional regulator
VSEAIILVNSEHDKELQVLDEVKRLDGIREVYVVKGMYNVLIKIEGESTEALNDKINRKIKRVNGVMSTITMYVNSTARL